METHVCPQCKVDKPLTPEFWFRNRFNPNGFDSSCKECKKKRAAEYRRQKRENFKINPDNLEYKTCSECGENYPPTTEHFNKALLSPDGLKNMCKDCEKLYNQEYHQKRYANPTIRKRINKQNKQWHNENKDFKNANVRKKYKNSAKMKRRAKESGRNRRAMLNNVDGSHTQDDIDLIYSEQEGRCFYCGISLLGTYEIDHMHPISRGGSNNPDNLCCTCRTCNRSKGNKTISEWEQIRGW